MIKNNIAKKLHALPTGHSDRIMSLRLPLQGDKSATLVSVYSPTLQADSAVKEAFYGDLHTVITRIDPKEKLIVLVLGWAETPSCGKEFLANMDLATATTTDACSCSFAPNTS